MQHTEIDRFPTSELPGRYHIGKTQFHNRRKSLGIEPQKDGREYFVSGDDLMRLDALDEHLRRGGTIESFGLPTSFSEPPKSLPSLDLAPVARAFSEPGELMQMMQRVYALLPIVLRSLPAAHPLAPQKAIEEAYQQGWQVTTSQLCGLLGMRSIKGSQIDRLGFRFIRCGKSGREGLWRIEKATRPEG